MSEISRRRSASRLLGLGAALAVSAAGLHAQAFSPRLLLVTVDDLPIASSSLHTDPADRQRITNDLLAVLAKHRIRAVGLVTGRNTSGPADGLLLERWLDAGHELGNHSWGRLDYTTTDSTAYIADVERGRAQLAEILEKRGARVRFFSGSSRARC